jgi:hypothetical protein
MVHYFLVKMISHIICYFASKKDHLNKNIHVKIDVQNDGIIFLMLVQMGSFLTILFNKRNYGFLIMCCPSLSTHALATCLGGGHHNSLSHFAKCSFLGSIYHINFSSIHMSYPSLLLSCIPRQDLSINILVLNLGK